MSRPPVDAGLGLLELHSLGHWFLALVDSTWGCMSICSVLVRVLPIVLRDSTVPLLLVYWSLNPSSSFSCACAASSASASPPSTSVLYVGSIGYVGVVGRFYGCHRVGWVEVAVRLLVVYVSLMEGTPLRREF